MIERLQKIVGFRNFIIDMMPSTFEDDKGFGVINLKN